MTLSLKSPPLCKPEEIQIFPYPYIEGISPEYLLANLWGYIQEDGVHSDLFPDGMRFAQWMAWADRLLYVMASPEEIIGAFWLYDVVSGVRAHIGMFFRKRYWDPGFTLPVGWRCLEEVCLNPDSPGYVPLLLANVIEENRLSRLYCRRMGFKEIARIANYFGPDRGVVLLSLALRKGGFDYGR